MDSISQTTSDYQAFLKLMTAQMQNQDPLAPMDATQFVTQLAQFSQVEQSVQANSKLDDLRKAIASISSQGSLALIGRDIEVASDVISLEEGSAEFTFAVDGDPSELRYTILNSLGQPVRSEAIVYEGGRQSITWDGRDNDGTMLDDGPYLVVINAKDANGKSLPSATFTTETVKQVIQEDGQTVLVLESGEMIDASEDMVIS